MPWWRASSDSDVRDATPEEQAAQRERQLREERAVAGEKLRIAEERGSGTRFRDEANARVNVGASPFGGAYGENARWAQQDEQLQRMLDSRMGDVMNAPSAAAAAQRSALMSHAATAGTGIQSMWSNRLGGVGAVNTAANMRGREEAGKLDMLVGHGLDRSKAHLLREDLTNQKAGAAGRFGAEMSRQAFQRQQNQAAFDDRLMGTLMSGGGALISGLSNYLNNQGNGSPSVGEKAGNLT